MIQGKKQQIGWINCAKFFAILAVLVDHVKGILYEDETIQYIFFYSVTVFIFLAGMTAYYSLQNRKAEVTGGKWVLRRLGEGSPCPLSGGGGCLSVRQNGISAESGGLCAVGAEFQSGGPVLLCTDYLQLIAIAPVLYLFVMNCRRGKVSFLFRIVFLVLASLDGIQLPDETQLCPGNLWRREISAGRHLFLRFCSRDAGG